ncbi:Uncharacterized protein FKW44_009447, partial [Caligus rogercresseyi]
ASEKKKKQIDGLFGPQLKTNSVLTKQEKNLVYELLIHFQHILSKDSSNVGRTEVLEFTVDTGDNTPIKEKVRPMNPTIRECFQTQLEQCKRKASWNPQSQNGAQP